MDAGPTSRILTIPNLLSILRLALLPVFGWLVLGPEADRLAVAVLLVIGVSDYLDGYLARALDQTSRLGAILDPVADRLYILVAVLALGFREIIPWWLAILLPARDLLLWGLVPILRTRGHNALPVHFLGKAATAALIYAFPLLLLSAAAPTTGAGPAIADASRVLGWAFALWGAGMYWWAGILYAWQVRMLLRRPADRARRSGPGAAPPPAPAGTAATRAAVREDAPTDA